MNLCVRLASLLALMFLVTACNGKNIAYVNTETIYQKSSVSEKGTTYLKGISSEVEAELVQLQKNVENAPKKDKQAAQVELQAAFASIQQRLNAEQQQVVTVWSDAYKKALEQCRQKYHISAFFPADVILSGDPALDLTEKVLEEMNTIPVTFTPLKEEAAQAPAPAPAQ